MKKIIALILALVLLLSTITVVSAAEPFADKKELNIVYLGGSITNGSKLPTCWVSLIGEQFAKRFPDKKVNNFNSGIGGTGTEFGLYRLQRDVIEHNPDIVFIDYAVNDRAKTKAETQRRLEGIVRQLMALEKKPVIIFVYFALADKKYPDDRPDNYVVTPPFPATESQEEIAKYYNIPSINLQAYIHNEVMPNKEKFEGVENVHSILPDAVHPQVLGNKIYADYIWKCISENEAKFFKLPTPQEKPLTGFEYKKTQMLFADEGIYSGDWSLVETSQKERLETSASSTQKGATATFKFTGTQFTLFIDRTPSGGTMSYSIDGAPAQTVSCKAETAGIVQPVLIENLEDKEHTVVFKNVDGGSVNVGAIGVDMPHSYGAYADKVALSPKKGIDNRRNKDQILTYNNVDNFESNIASITVAGKKLTADQYKLGNSELVLKGELFKKPNLYTICVETKDNNPLVVNLNVLGDDLIYNLASPNCTKSTEVWYSSPTIKGPAGIPTSYTNDSDCHVEWAIGVEGEYSIGVWKVCHPTAGTRFLMAEVKHKDGIFKTPAPLNCIAEIDKGSYEFIGDFTFTGDGTEYIKLYLADGHDGAFFRPDSIIMKSTDAPVTEEPEETEFSISNKAEGKIITASIKNGSDRNIECASAICVAFNNGKLEQIIVKAVSVNQGADATVEFEFVNDTEGKTIKTFLWESLGDELPLASTL